MPWGACFPRLYRSAALSGERLAGFLIGALVQHGAGASPGAARAARLVGGAPRGPAEVARRLLGASAALLERSSLPVAYRWRYALALEMVGKPCLFDRALSMLHAATGAWAAGSKPHPCPAVPSPGAFSGPMASRAADRCPVYRSIHSAIDITTAYKLLGAD